LKLIEHLKLKSNPWKKDFKEEGLMLPINFHKTFIPERHLITALLEYAALGKEGTIHEMAEDTGIPMGKYSGKMQAIIAYCRGMGLITVEPGRDKKYKKPTLTQLGEAIILNDKHLGEPLSQWLVHMNLCRNDIGAKAWHKVFAEGRDVLGVSFTAEQLESYLVDYFGKGRNRTGPLVSAYTDDAALGRAKVLTVKDMVITRHKAPIIPSWATAYSAMIIELLESHFPGQAQVTLTEFTEKTNWFNVCLWHDSDIEAAFSLIEIKGFVVLDRQIRPWILEKKARAQDVWPHVFDDIA
jgi:hypothetical protein